MTNGYLDLYVMLGGFALIAIYNLFTHKSAEKSNGDFVEFSPFESKPYSLAPFEGRPDSLGNTINSSVIRSSSDY